VTGRSGACKEAFIWPVSAYASKASQSSGAYCNRLTTAGEGKINSGVAELAIAERRQLAPLRGLSEAVNGGLDRV
jgi:hypothetical protein